MTDFGSHASHEQFESGESLESARRAGCGFDGVLPSAPVHPRSGRQDTGGDVPPALAEA